MAKAYLRPRRGIKATAEAQLTSSNPLKRGEVFFEVPDTGVGTGAGKIKMGDGTTGYADLPYFSEGGSGGSGAGSDITILLPTAAWTTETISDVQYWVQNGACAGATTNTVPVIVPIYTTDAEMEAYSNIFRVEPSANILKFIAVAKPSVNLTVVAKFAVESIADLETISDALGVEITQAEYDLLSPQEKAHGTYWITDGSAGVVMDTTLNINSHNGIENAPVAAAINQINADLSELERKVGMPILDYANPLHTFSSNNHTYTASKDCYLAGVFNGISSNSLSINGTVMAVGGTSGAGQAYSVFYKLKSGDIVTTNSDMLGLHVFDVVS